VSLCVILHVCVVIVFHTHTHKPLWQLCACVCALCSLLLLTGHVCVILHAKLRPCRRVSAFGPVRQCQGSMAW